MCKFSGDLAAQLIVPEPQVLELRKVCQHRRYSSSQLIAAEPQAADSLVRSIQPDTRPISNRCLRAPVELPALAFQDRLGFKQCGAVVQQLLALAETGQDRAGGASLNQRRIQRRQGDLQLHGIAPRQRDCADRCAVVVVDARQLRPQSDRHTAAQLVVEESNPLQVRQGRDLRRDFAGQLVVVQTQLQKLAEVSERRWYPAAELVVVQPEEFQVPQCGERRGDLAGQHVTPQTQGGQ